MSENTYQMNNKSNPVVDFVLRNPETVIVTAVTVSYSAAYLIGRKAGIKTGAKKAFDAGFEKGAIYAMKQGLVLMQNPAVQKAVLG